MKRFLTGMFLAIAAAAIAPAADSSMAGKWVLHFNISGYSGDLDCAFTQKDKDVAGSCKNPDGNVSVTGKVDGAAVTLQYKTEYNGDELTVIYTGKMESPTKLSGTVNVQPIGADGDFTATQSN